MLQHKSKYEITLKTGEVRHGTYDLLDKSFSIIDPVTNFEIIHVPIDKVLNYKESKWDTPP